MDAPKSYYGLGEISTSIKILETAKINTQIEYNPQLYIDILNQLNLLYFQQEEYLTAFYTKQEKLQIEQQYGFRAFVGASYLNPQRKIIKSADSDVGNTGTIAQEISASGREQDIINLKTRIADNQYKLTVIHGQSGVGKSSILQAGLIPALQQETIAAKQVLPLLLRVYTNWLEELGKALNVGKIHELSLIPRPTDAIIQQLRKNSEKNLLTVLIFDQFEEFFFVYQEQIARQEFYDFLRECLDIPDVKVVLSLREDYLHYLLEIERKFENEKNTDIVNSTDIIGKSTRYYLGNFSPADAKQVFISLTQRSKYRLEEKLIDKLVAELAGKIAEIRPIELQIVGTQLENLNITTLEKYQEIGNKEKLIEGFLDNVVKDCGTEDNKELANLALYLFTDENKTRPLKTASELAEELTILDRNTDKLEDVVKILVASGLVLLIPEFPENRYQLVHDYLVEFIRQQYKDDLLENYAKAKTELELAKQNELLAAEKLKKEQEANQILIQAREQAEKLLKEAQKGTELERAGMNALRQFEFAQLEGLMAAMHSGKQLKNIVKDGRPLEKYPAFSPIHTLNTILDNIKERNQFKGHQGNVNSVSFSPDGKTIATASSDKTARLWNLQGQMLQEFKGHQNRVDNVSFSPDGKTIATASLDNTARLWNLQGQMLQEFKGHLTWVRSVSFSPDGNTIATTSSDKTARLWNLQGQMLQELKGHQEVVWSASFSPDGQIIATASNDKTVRLWNLQGQLVQEFTGHQSGVHSVNFSPDGQTIATASLDNTARLWNLQGQLMREFIGHQGVVYSVSFSPDGQTIATSSSDNTTRLWNLYGELLQEFTGYQGFVLSVSFSPDGQTIATASTDNTARVSKLQGQLIQKFKGHQGPVYSVSFSPDGKTITTASLDMTARLWNLQGQILQEFKGHQSRVISVSFSPDGQTIATTSFDCTARLWNLQGQTLQEFKGHHNHIHSVSFSPDGQTIITASLDWTARLWNLQGQMLQEFKGHKGPVYSVNFSPDGQTIATTSEDKTVRLWNLKGQLLQEFKGHQGLVWSVSFSPDGKTIATASEDKTARLWNLQGQLLQEFKGHQLPVYSVSFSPDGKTIATASWDGTARLWPVRDLDRLLVLGCAWLKDYLQNPNMGLSEEDKRLCDDVKLSESGFSGFKDLQDVV
ncbi:eIF2A-related protein [Anabaena azotica]|uniref:WD40 domain-containing protein n=1 Tax=Anabaena azotica TaxID=197653 RepID=UPI0039A5764B